MDSNRFDELLPDNSTKYGERTLKDYRKSGKSTKRGPVDLPFLVLTLIILTIGVIMVLSASFARASSSCPAACATHTA